MITRVLTLLALAVIGLLVASSALASESPPSSLKISISVMDLATSSPVPDRATIAPGTPFQVTVSSNVDCAGQFVVTALGSGEQPSLLVQTVAFIIGPTSVTGSELVAGVLPSGVNDFKVSASCNGAASKSFDHDDFEFFVDSAAS